MGNGFWIFLLRGEPQRGEEPLRMNTLLPNNVRKNKIRKGLSLYEDNVFDIMF